MLDLSQDWGIIIMGQIPSKSLNQILTDRAKGLRVDVGRRQAGEANITHVPTGFNVIDRTFGGIRRGTTTELMAHTGDGKSTFARQICESVAKSGGGVLWFCGEDPEDATAERYLADGAGITATQMGRLDLSVKELAAIDKTATSASSWAKRVEVIFEAPTVDEVLERVLDTKSVGGASLLLGVFDYAQIFGDSTNLETEIAKLSTKLNQMSGERRLASLLLSQVSNDVIRRGRDKFNSSHDINGYIPTLGDTEWCRRAEKSCKAVWSLIRPGRWIKENGEEAEDNTAELHVKKANFGPLGWETIGWDGPKCRFFNI